ncbi:MAG: hypothetical protein J6B32_07735 [Spirochaetaceae bacterium]|nr:hypothetical protein [Spirochaetaceae bacterium]MBO5236982.1 hypothetical protein [Spirochaetaceae bacterium]
MTIHPLPNDYSDILYTKWPITDKRVKMPLLQRAKIFLPFSALKGHEKAIEERRQNSLITEPKKIQFFEDFMS